MNNERKYYVYGYIRLDNNSYFYIGKGCNNRYLRLDNRKNHFMNIINSIDCVVEILKDNLTEEEAFNYEKSIIYDLVFREGYSIEIKGIDRNENGNHLVNCTWGGEGTSGLSVKQSQETIDKRVSKNKGKRRNSYQKENLRNARLHRFNLHPEERERLKTLRCGATLSNETKCKISNSHKGKKLSKEHIEKIKKSWNELNQETKDYINYKRADSEGTSIRCIELDIIFPSINYAIKYIKNKYNILFNHHSLSNTLKGKRKYDWYGEN